ncbi:hypothetical protein CDD83_5648 [Cordyceps sp. RAO-2017]|nr:hypothetical protein CDD83_5648 [Cordyceps sp. RAO-2017]
MALTYLRSLFQKMPPAQGVPRPVGGVAAGHVVGAQPGERPPALVVVELVDEVVEASPAEPAAARHAAAPARVEAVGRADDAVLDGFDRLHARLLRLHERVVEEAADVELVGPLQAEVGEVGQGRDGVGAVPPRVVVHARHVVVEVGVEAADGLEGPLLVRLAVRRLCRRQQGQAGDDDDDDGRPAAALPGEQHVFFFSAGSRQERERERERERRGKEDEAEDEADEAKRVALRAATASGYINRHEQQPAGSGSRRQPAEARDKGGCDNVSWAAYCLPGPPFCCPLPRAVQERRLGIAQQPLPPSLDVCEDMAEGVLPRPSAQLSRLDPKGRAAASRAEASASSIKGGGV